MAKDFFDGLGETLSKTAKELGEKAEVLYEIQKLRNKISGEERIVDKFMTDIGNMIYKKYVQGEAMEGEVEKLCESIFQHMQIISGLKEKAADLKGQKICSSCGRTVDREVLFCPYCGVACPTAEPEEAAGDVVIEQEDQSMGSEESKAWEAVEEAEPAEKEEQ